jgi:hypothetical protein
MKSPYEIMVVNDSKLVIVPLNEENCKIPRIINTINIIFAENEEDAKLVATKYIEETLKEMQ